MRFSDKPVSDKSGVTVCTTLFLLVYLYRVILGKNKSCNKA